MEEQEILKPINNRKAMGHYEYNIKVSAANSTEANLKVTALGVLAQKLKAKELEALANVVKNDPVKTAFAKRALGI